MRDSIKKAVIHLFDAIRRQWRRQPIWLIGIICVLLVALYSVIIFVLAKLDPRYGIFRSEE
ncbi:MAG: hypothetical protein AABP62_29815, partial [Planctomycetota bacterium]